MRTLVLALAVSLAGTAAFADTTVIRKEGIDGDTTIVKKESMDGTVTKRTVETTGSVGCETKSVTKSDGLGDSVTKTKTEC